MSNVELKELPSSLEDLPKDPEVIAKMLGIESEETDGEGKAVEASSEAEAKTGNESAEHGGERTVPVAVIAAERERTRQERAARAAAEQEAESLREQIEAIKAGKSTQEQRDDIEEQIEQLREDFPGMADLFSSLASEVKTLRGSAESAEVKAAREAEEAERNAEHESALAAQALIDANPKLLYWQTEKPDLFEAAIGVDDQLANHPEFGKLPVEARFARAVAAVEAIYGVIDVPAAYLPKPTQTEEHTRARAEKAVKDAGVFTPRSLSDLPGGMPPASDDIGSVDNIPAHQLGNMFTKMSREKQDEFLAKFA